MFNFKNLIVCVLFCLLLPFLGEAKVYVFAYGSLISRQSRERTLGRISKGIRVRVDGFQRGFYAPMRKGIALTVKRKAGTRINGILFEVSEAELELLDRREGGHNKRIRVKRDQVAPYSGAIRLSRGKIWTYMYDEPKSPSREYPVLQSYIDVVLSGCLAVTEGRNFAKEFVRTTKNLDTRHWVNDRSGPLYSRRGDVYISRITQDTIDEILAGY